ARRVEIHAVRIAETVGDDFAVLRLDTRAARFEPRAAARRREPQDTARNRFLDRRRRQRGVGLVDAGRIAAQDVEPAVAAAADGVGGVLAARLHRPQQFRRTGRPALLDAKAAQTAIARHVERVAFPTETHGPVFRRIGDLDRAVGAAVAV